MKRVAIVNLMFARAGIDRRVGQATARCVAIASAVVLALVVPAAAGAAPMLTSISAGNGHTCATLASGQVDCWGKEYVSGKKSVLPVAVPGVSAATTVVTGQHFDCALLTTRRVACWGDDGYGQLGDGRTVDSAKPVSVAGVTSAVAIAAGRFHACAVLADGGVRCWGRNFHGALGNGQTRDSSVPVAVSGITNAVRVSIADLEDQTCALLASGEARCWGLNTRGQLGTGSTVDSRVPSRVAGVAGLRQIAPGGAHTCGVLTSASVECWGENSHGELGNGTLRASRIPVKVSLPPASAVAVEAHGYACALTQAGTVYCWGHNPKNQLGDGLYPTASSVPVQVLGVSGATSISVARGHACAMLSTGGADCWGYNDYGQLGSGAGLPRIRNATPVVFPPEAPAQPQAQRPAHRRPRHHR